MCEKLIKYRILDIKLDVYNIKVIYNAMHIAADCQAIFHV
jgi:hypothetical protein